MEPSIKLFVPLGTQKFPFNRLIKALNKLITEGVYKPEEIIMQSSVYEIEPMFTHYQTLPIEEFNRLIKIAEVIITHSGVNSIITCMNMNKPLIIAPRLKIYGEHVDNHQLEIANLMFQKFGIITLLDFKNIKDAIEKAKVTHYNQWISKRDTLINQLKEELDKMFL